MVNNNYYQGAIERQGSVYLGAGQHSMEIQYFQGGGGDSLTATLPAGVSYVYEQPTLAVYNDPTPLPGGNPVPPPLIPADAVLVGGIPTTDVNFGVPGSNWSPFGLSANFSAEMQAEFAIPTSGFYTFSTDSDDGTYLFIDGQTVVSNAYYQGYGFPRSGTIYLTAGNHPFDLQYFQGGGGAALTMSIPAGVTIVSAPEPATLLQMLTPLGLMALVMQRRRRLAALGVPLRR